MSVVVSRKEVVEPTGTPWQRLFRRLVMVLLRPSRFWAELQTEELTIKEMLFPHVALLLVVRGVAGLVGDLMGGVGVGSAVLGLLSSMLGWFGLIWLLAIAASTLAGVGGGRLSPLHGLRLSAYGLTPLFVAGVLAAVPLRQVAPVAELVAMPWAFYVMAHGVVPCLGVKDKRAITLIAQLNGLTLVLWSVLPTVLPQAIVAISG